MTRQTPKSYQAATSLIINIPNSGSSSEALQGLQLSTQLLKSYASIATSRTAAARVKQRLDLPEPVDVIRASISATPQPETLLITITATAGDTRQSELIADAAAAVFIEAVNELERGKSARADPRIVDPAVASSTPVSPRPRVNLAIGLFVGAVTGVGLALLLEALDRAVKTPAQAEAAFGAPTLSVIPRLPTSRGRHLPSLDSPLSPAGEAYRSLRTAVQFIRPDRPLRTILVTSPSAGEGKTTTATNLAIALADAGNRVVLVDADLRRGRVTEVMGLPGGVGVTSVIMKTADLQDVLLGWRDLLTVLATGPFPPNPSEIVGSEAMLQILEELKQLADVVVVDCPPLLPVTDAVALATQVDGVLLVTRFGRTERKAAAEARQRLDRVGATVIGCVLNGTPGARSGYYTGYYTGYQRGASAKYAPASGGAEGLTPATAEPLQPTGEQPPRSAESR